MANTIDSSVTTGVNAATASASASKASDELSNNFMTLLVTQLQNQDPLNPMDNSEMTSQLAQINTVAGIEDLNASMAVINDQINAGKAIQAAQMIGEGVLVPGDRVLVTTTEDGQTVTTPFGIELKEPAADVTVTITNDAGEVVNSYDLGPASAGVDSFQWDGMTADGTTAAADGAYKVTIEATGAEGKKVDVTALNYAIVGGVTPADANGDIMLDLGAVYGQVSLDEVRQIL
ncbi:flagellar hook assembly protein FlgD [Halomonas cupida]|uniref:Basal-body rod modification protein FlgD n=1 Tax=Halomonas cupida TaxID=44933 RepID=A0A1M7G4C3_9GAMM|nr:flagellar hook assembly protein FlgD [Halomonas cupida]GEN23638.1 basal-body rod modification protein FlgD [Halomonas cupida]SHM10938.1 flagellar basal-body rod modification protein FlgD [Halomonas cupida]